MFTLILSQYPMGFPATFSSFVVIFANNFKNMNRLVQIFSVIAFLFFVSCGENAEQKLATSEVAVQVKENMAGNYEGNLGCADCAGLKTILEIKADSSFIIRETKLTSGVLSEQESFTGKLNFISDKSMIELIGREDGKTKWLKSADNGSLQIVTQDGQPVVDSLGGGSLNRLTKWTQTIGNVNVYEYVTPFSKYPAKVFHRIQNGDITIDRNYIANAPEHEKALIAYYTTAYKAGCVGDVCILESELKGQAENLTKKYFQNDPVIKPILDGKMGEATEELELLMIFNNQGKLRVQTSTLGPEGKMISKADEFSLSGENLILLNSKESDNTRKRAVSNVRSRDAGPSSQAEREKIMNSREKSPATSTQKK
jgi:NlpE N-terminal domain